MKKFITYEDVVDMILRRCAMQIPDSDVQYAFGMSKMAVTSEPGDYKKYNTMQFAEYLEFIGRLADAKYKNSDDSV